MLSFLPTLCIGILFGLAMDYQMFLVSGMREAWAHGQDARTAVRTGFSHGAKVITTAGLIMVSVFASFIFSDTTLARPIGFALGIGVLIDAFVVRMTIIPALMHLIGEAAWYLPKRLDRILPDLDVENLAKYLSGAPSPTHVRWRESLRNRYGRPEGAVSTL
ncbi:MAG: MMPL family transporter [Propionicimonas sp.]